MTGEEERTEVQPGVEPPRNGAFNMPPQEEVHWYQTLFEAMGDAVLVCHLTPEGTPTHFAEANDAACRLLGYTRAELLERSVEDLLDPETSDLDVYLARLRDTGEIVVEVAHKTGDGRAVPLEVRARLIDIKGRPTVLAVCRNVAAQRQAESATALLAEAGSVLATSLDYEETLAAVADLVVPGLADWCAVDLITSTGTIQRVAVAHVDAAKVQLAYELLERYPVDPEAPRGVPNVVRTGETEFYPEIDEALLRQIAQHEAHHRALADLGLSAALVVPLTARDRTLGALTLAMAESGRVISEDDQALAEELARRCALSVDNARLYREAHDEIQERRRLEEEFRTLSEAIPQQVWTANPQGELLYVNSRVTDYFDMSAEQIIGEGWMNVVHEDDLMPTVKRWMHALDTGEPYETEFRLRRARDGEYRWHIGRALPLRDDDGKIVKWFGTNTDISARKKTEATIRRLAAIVESSNDAILSKTLDGTITSWNEAAQRLYGFTSEEAVGQSIHLIVPDDRRDELEGIFARLRRGERIEHFETVRHTKHGDLLDISLAISPMKGPDGEVIGAAAVARDISGRKRMERQLQRRVQQQAVVAALGREALRGTGLQDLLDAAVREVAAKLDVEYCKVLELLPDRSGVLLRAGVGWQDGLVGEAIVGIGMESQAGYTLASDVPVIVEDLRTEERFSGPELLRAHGVVSGLSVIIQMQDGPYGVLGAHTAERRDFDEDDVHFVQAVANLIGEAVARERNEAQLRELNESLERRVAERTTELEHANLQLEQRNRELQDFAYVASHDLQEPLRKIRAFSDLMRQDYEEEVDETGQYYLERMQDAAARMSGLINDLLAFSRVATRGKPFEPVDLNRVLHDVLSDLEVRIEEADAVLQTALMPTIEADPTQMRQLLQNLIGNAIKFSREGVRPVITLRATLIAGEAATKTDGQQVVRLEVKDNGIGFDVKYLDRIFAPFQRLAGHSAYEGSGIGLAICRRIVERHNGHITAESTPGEGTTFIVTLPVRHQGQSSGR